MGAHGVPPIPDYTQFKVEGIKKLEELRDALAKKGLKDPWIRNEAWRYNPGYGTRWQRARALFFRGFPIGLGLTVLTVAVDKIFFGGDDHGHGHGHGHGGHEGGEH